MHAAHMCLSEELIPKDLLPISNSVGTVSPISGPATYQGQGDDNQFKIFIVKIYSNVFMVRLLPVKSTGKSGFTIYGFRLLGQT